MSDATHLRIWSDRFALLGDPNRLALLLKIRDEGPICVSDLAAATGLKPTAVSQALRLLRAHNIVHAHRDGNMKCYALTDPRVGLLLNHALDPAEPGVARSSQPGPT